MAKRKKQKKDPSQTRGRKKLSKEELEKKDGEQLPDREAMSLLGGPLQPGVFSDAPQDTPNMIGPPGTYPPQEPE